MPKQPKLLIVTPSLGAYSEVWLWRQIIEFKCFHPSVLTWQYINQESFPIPGVPVENMQLDFNKKTSLAERLNKRFCGLYDHNFCRPSRHEKRKIYDFIKKIQPDVVLCHFGYTALRILPIVKALNLPLVVHFHGLDLSSSLRNKWYRWSLKSSFRHFVSIVVVGQHQYEWITRQGVNEANVALIPCGVPTHEFLPRYKTDVPHEQIQFIAVSRLTEKKGLEYTIAAFRKIKDNLPGSRLIIVGDGPLRGKLEALVASLTLQNSVEFVGSALPEKVRNLLCDSDIFVQHSVIASSGDMEGSPVAIAEASASGLPVVTTRGSGGTEDLIMNGRSGFLVKQRDTIAMADAMLKLANDPSMRAMMGKAGREHMIEHFDTKKQVQKLEMVLGESVNRWKISV